MEICVCIDRDGNTIDEEFFTEIKNNNESEVLNSYN